MITYYNKYDKNVPGILVIKFFEKIEIPSRDYLVYDEKNQNDDKINSNNTFRNIDKNVLFKTRTTVKSIRKRETRKQKQKQKAIYSK